ncbi:hypothetical protein DFH07DRAFT_766618 [Mycena maculata]|uniref:Uncharacterized protein n=1 Tax=Mycena maculata TaxID=230809 RepID=A0AAD7NUR9_9AGAR|nr:hypothetical protein DFH07DRAFT_766618 [Mycena maculata]
MEQWRRRLQLEGRCFLYRRPHVWTRPLPYLGPDEIEDIRDRPQAEERTSEKGEALATLSVGTSEWVQTVATAEIGGVSVVFAAQTRALDFSEEIFVWKRAQETSTGWGKMGALVKALVVLGCIAFVYQNLMMQIRVLQSINM